MDEFYYKNKRGQNFHVTVSNSKVAIKNSNLEYVLIALNNWTPQMAKAWCEL